MTAQHKRTFMLQFSIAGRSNIFKLMYLSDVFKLTRAKELYHGDCMNDRLTGNECGIQKKYWIHEQRD